MEKKNLDIPPDEILAKVSGLTVRLFPWQFIDGQADGLLKQYIMDHAGIRSMDALVWELFELGAHERGKLTFVEYLPDKVVKELILKEQPADTLVREEYIGSTFATFRAGVEWLAQHEPVEVPAQVIPYSLHPLARYKPKLLLDGQGEPLLCASVTNNDAVPVAVLAHARRRQQIRMHLQAAYPYFRRSIEAAARRRKKSAEDIVHRFLSTAALSEEKEIAAESLKVVNGVEPGIRDIRAGERRMAALAAAAATGKKVSFSKTQLAVLDALKGRAMSLEELAKKIDVSERTVEKEIRKLKDMGLVEHMPGRGYYSTQSPPPDLDILKS